MQDFEREGDKYLIWGIRCPHRGGGGGKWAGFAFSENDLTL